MHLFHSSTEIQFLMFMHSDKNRQNVMTLHHDYETLFIFSNRYFAFSDSINRTLYS